MSIDFDKPLVTLSSFYYPSEVLSSNNIFLSFYLD